MKPPTYLETIARMWRDGVIPRGAIVDADVVHQSDCAFLNGLTTCDCRPFVSVRRVAA